MLPYARCLFELWSQYGADSDLTKERDVASLPEANSSASQITMAKSKGSDLLQSEILHLSVPPWDMLRVTIYITLQVDHKWVKVSTTSFKHIARLGPTPDAAR